MLGGRTRALIVASVLVSSCTHGHTSPAPSSTPEPDAAIATLCADARAIVAEVAPLLDRLDQGTEAKGRIQADLNRVDELSRRLYRDTAPFANPSGAAIFSLMAGLTADLSPLVYGEFGVHDAPSQIPQATVDKVRADLDAISRAVESRVLPCPQSSPSSQ